MNEDLNKEVYLPWLVVIMLVGTWLRVLLLGTKGMWLDETFSVWIANHNIGDMLQWIVKIDQHPPLYYFLLHYWIAFRGDTPYYVRFLSALFSAATIPIIFLIGKRIASPMTGLAAAMLLAFSPFHIYYAQETRMYSLLTFNAAVAIYALVRLMTDPCSARPIGSQFREFWRTWRSPKPAAPGSKDDFSDLYTPGTQTGWRAALARWISRHGWLPIEVIKTDLTWVAFILFSAATLLTHNTAILYFAAINIAVAGLMLFQRARKPGAQYTFQAPPFGNWAKAQIGILLLWSPWIVPFVRQSSGVYQHFWIPKPTWDTIAQALRSFVMTTGPLPGYILSVLWIIYGLAFCLALVFYRKKLSQLFFLAALFAIPFLGELIVSIWRPIFYDRTLIWITIPLFLVLAAGVAQLKSRFLIMLALGLLGTINLFSVSDYFRFYPKEDWNTAARSIAGYTEKSDLILFNSNFVEVAFNYYFKPYEEFYNIQVEKRGLPQDLFESGVLEPEMTAKDVPGLVSLVSGHQRVWLVYSHNWYTDPQGLIPKTLESHMKLIRKDDFYGGQVFLYEKP